MAYSAYQFNANALYQPVNQVAHGFLSGDIVRWNGAAWVKAVATSEDNSALPAMVSQLSGVDSFYITQAGFVSGITSQVFVAGTFYYLDTVTPGLLVTAKPNNVGEVVVQCFRAFTTTSGFFMGGPGVVVESGSLFTYTTVAVNTAMGVNQGYNINGGGSINMLLPAASSEGDRIEIATLGTNGCVITQNAGQSVNMVDETSTIGAGGTTTLLSTNGVLSGSLILECQVANTVWKAIAGTGVWDPA